MAAEHELGVFILLAVVGIFIRFLFVVIIPEKKASIVERFGRHNRVLQTGIHLVWWPIEHLKTISWQWNDERGRAHKKMAGHEISTSQFTYDPPSITIITKDRVEVNINTVMFLQITDVQKAAYETVDLFNALQESLLTSLRKATSRMDFEEIIGKQDLLEAEIFTECDKRHNAWGVKLLTLEIQAISAKSRAIMKATEDIVQAKSSANLALLNQRVIRDGELARAKAAQELMRIELDTQKIEHDFVLAKKTAIAQQEHEIRGKRYECFNASGLPTACWTAELYTEALQEVAKTARATLVIPYEAAPLAALMAHTVERTPEQQQ